MDATLIEAVKQLGPQTVILFLILAGVWKFIKWLAPLIETVLIKFYHFLDTLTINLDDMKDEMKEINKNLQNKPCLMEHKEHKDE